MTEYKAMTARDLLEALRALSEADLDLAVTTEGCDCHGDVGRVVVQATSGCGTALEVLLWRTDGRLQLDQEMDEEEARDDERE